MALAIFEAAALLLTAGVVAALIVTLFILAWGDILREFFGRRSPLKSFRRFRYGLQHAAAIVLAVCVLAKVAAHLRWNNGDAILNVVLLGFCGVGVWLMVCLAAWFYEDYARPRRRKQQPRQFDELQLRDAIENPSTQRRRAARLRIRLPEEHRQTVAFKRF